ncbi:phosphatidylglycerophosphatase A [Candidatus Omnitrophota bacterium]
MSKLVRTITTFFGLGYSPVASGTIGSLGGILVYFLVKDNPVAYTLMMISFFILGMGLSGRAEKHFKKFDASPIVIDEVCGMLVSLYLLPYNIYLVIGGFIIFRIMDIIKPPPAGNIQKKGGAWGIMGDDLIAAIYTNLLLRLIILIF